VTPGVWTSPFGTATTFVAMQVDSVTSPLSFPVGARKVFGVRAKNSTYVAGDIIINETATISDQLLSSVSNTVRSTILPTSPYLNTLAGKVYEDKNVSNLYEGTDKLLSGLTVSLYSSTGALVGTVVTDASGAYSFLNLPDDTYAVSYDPSPASRLTPSVSHTGTIDTLAM